MVLSLLLILLLAALAISLVLYAGGLFLQGYYYTEPSPTIVWGAPAGGFLLASFLLLWCILIVNTPGAAPEAIPYDTIFRFSPRVDMVKEPVKELIVVNKKGEEIRYKRQRDPTRGFNLATSIYLTDQDFPKPWPRHAPYEKIIITVDGVKHEFKRVPTAADDVSGHRSFVSDDGWILKEREDGPDGVPQAYRWSRFFANVALNVLHLGLWFGVLWLLLRFQWAHALGLAFCMWLVFTLVLMPMLLHFAAELAAGAR